MEHAQRDDNFGESGISVSFWNKKSYTPEKKVSNLVSLNHGKMHSYLIKQQ